MIGLKHLFRFSHRKVADRLSRLTEILVEMPKDPAASRMLKQQRIAKAKDREALLEKPSSAVSLHVLGNGGPGNPASVMLITDHFRYLFNCGEGTQRLAVEHAMKLAKLQHVFLTQCTWKNFGGLPGMSMTLQSMGVPALTVHAPTPILPLYEMTRLFSVTAELDVNQRTPDDRVYTDSNITVTYVVLRKSADGRNETGDADDSNASSESRNGKRIRLDDHAGPANDVVMNYICKLPPLPGALDIVKCFELKVPKGPALGQLKAGQDYVFPDGRVVKSADVVKPDDPGPVFLVIDCPTLQFMDSLISNPEITHYQTTTDEKDMPGLVVHFSPPEVVNDSRYKEWMSKFPVSVLHMGINENNSNKAFVGSSALLSKLRCLDEQIFPLSFSSVNHSDVQQTEASFVSAQTLLKTNLRPAAHPVKLDTYDVVHDIMEESVKEMSAGTGVAEAIREYKQKVAEIERTASAGGSGDSEATERETYPIITFLGTASAAPSKHRNTSFIHVEVDADTVIIFDGGEGSYGQLFRLFGPDRIESELKKIKAVFVSHHHADHHLGLIYLLQKRSLVTSDKVALFLPQSVHNWLLDYDRVYERVAHLFYCIQNENLLSNNNHDKDLMQKLNLSNLQTARVNHCRDSFGITITTRVNPFKVVFSGDAMPSPYLAVAGKDCDVLIHEATMEDDLEDEAVIKRHSTTSQAVGMGKKMNAKYTILTHFSQRYAKLPMIDVESFEENKVGCAFDNLRLRRGDYDRLVHLNRALNICFMDVTIDYMKRIERTKNREKVFKKFVLNE